MARLKFYTVWKGLNTGVFSSWADCQKQIKGVEGAQYKSFPTRATAEYALSKSYWDYVTKASHSPKSSVQSQGSLSTKIISDSICVDAACSGNPGVMEYRCVETSTKKEIFASPKYEDATNNIGEFLGLVHALALCKKKNVDIVIYTDSKTAISWVKNKKVKTSLAPTSKNKVVFDLIDRAIYWLKSNDFNNQIIKWETEKWGEIPADYGRK